MQYSINSPREDIDITETDRERYNSKDFAKVIPIQSETNSKNSYKNKLNTIDHSFNNTNSEKSIFSKGDNNDNNNR